MRVLIATPAFGGLITTGYLNSLLETISKGSEEGHEFGVYTLANESLVTRARNRCASAALAGGWDKLLFIDADITWRWAHVAALLASQAYVTGGTYPVKAYPVSLNFTPLPKHEHYFYGGRKDPMAFLRYAEESDEHEEIQVRHLPTGFLLIDCSVFRELKPQTVTYNYHCLISGQTETHWDFFQSRATGKHTYLSEDWYFCEQLLRIGVTPVLNTGVIVDHTGTHTFSAREPNANSE